ncbi:MAG: hypothetical protein NWE92_08600 [Candidatus Bathyarchaeota archaeon]|nr:hypothetical protein [Candidatus Bathyarchaeota archaeon]
MQKTLTDNRFFNHLRHLHLIEKLLIQGVFVVAVLVIAQVWINSETVQLISYMPPFGFAFLAIITYLIQPLIIGVLNIVLIQLLYKTRGWQVGFWLNGIFLVLLFTSVNLVMQTTTDLSFTSITVIDLVLLSFPFGVLARFSNGGWKKPIN